MISGTRCGISGTLLPTQRLFAVLQAPGVPKLEKVSKKWTVQMLRWWWQSLRCEDSARAQRAERTHDAGDGGGCAAERRATGRSATRSTTHLRSVTIARRRARRIWRSAKRAPPKLRWGGTSSSPDQGCAQRNGKIPGAGAEYARHLANQIPSITEDHKTKRK